jgi:uncharacterized membrane protein (UPF0182 family)
MKPQASRRTKMAIIGIVVLIVLLLISTNAINILVDWLWFDSLDQLRTYQTRIWTRLALWLGSGLLVAGVCLVNWLLIPRRLLGKLQIRLRTRRGAGLSIGTRLFVIVLSLVATLVALTMAGEVSARWMTFLRLRYGVPFNRPDPLFGLDIGFYLFRLPAYQFLVRWILALIVISLVGAVLIYLVTGYLRDKRAAIHLSILAALFLLVMAADYQLQRFTLLTSSRGVVFGAGYTDVHARMPLLHILTGLVLLGMVLLLLNAFMRQWRLLLAVGAAWILLSLVGPSYPELVQRFTVQPNELALERPYIEHNTSSTRYAYGLEDVIESDYQPSGGLLASQIGAHADTLENIRLWDWRPLRTTYEQLQEIRTYYTFTDVDVDRYLLDGELRQVMLAVREMNVAELREDARTWVNQHLIYTHGYGLCLSPAAQVSPEGLPNLLVRDIPPQSAFPELVLTRPEIYFGEATTNYVIVDTSEDEFDYPQGDQNVYTRYAGPDGVPVGGLLRRLVLASYFNSNPILLSNAITPDSRIMFRRTVEERARTLAPMLWFDPDPYPVTIDGRIIWLYDAYTWSERFPYSAPGWDAEPVWGLNYIRNSVKVTIDAYTGETVFYVVDRSDPLIQTYRAIFPELFTDVSEMDPRLRDHWRYPERLYEIQASIYAAYHMQDPRVFYNQEDLWQAPTEILDIGQESPMAPYYVIMALPQEEGPEFLMIRPYVPAGKQNMIAWLYADSDGEDYGALGVYKFSKEALVYGPIQVEARFSQDAYISQQLTLWNQQGSSVIRGNLLVIPLDGTILYVEPLYLQAETGRLPELKRVLAAHGNRVAMAEDLATALAQVLGAPAAEPSIEPLPEDMASLARSAQAHYQASQLCLQRGDWTCYGAELEALERDLEALVAALKE